MPIGGHGGFAGVAVCFADDDQHRSDRNGLALRDEDPSDLACSRRRNLDRRLVRLDLDERIVFADLLALGDQPARDLPFGQPLAEVRQLELIGHGAGIYRRGIACDAE
jgi:hypothetical protein